jgi:hypothetical protein
MIRSIIIVTPGLEAWGTFKKLCKAKGWVYQTLLNQKKSPKIGSPVEISGSEIHKVFLK